MSLYINSILIFLIYLIYLHFQMLIALALFDSGYLFGSILESFRKSFHMTTSLHVILFPYFLYPGKK